jgi:hypothetical protein
MADVTHLAHRLWIGSAPHDARGRERFDVIMLCAQEWQPSSRLFPTAIVRRCPFDDGGMGDDDVQIAMAAAEQVARDLVSGRTVLVTCRLGRNRSALVSALALHLLTGESATRMGRLVRSKRKDPTGVSALSNDAMWDVLRHVDRTVAFS